MASFAALPRMGRPRSSLIQTASDSGNADALVFFLFDLLYLDGEAISPAPLRERKEHLRDLLSNAGTPLQYSDHQIGRGQNHEEFVVVGWTDPGGSRRWLGVVVAAPA